MEGNIEDVAALPGEPRGEATELVVMLEEQHAMPGLGQDICPGETPQPAADYDDVVLVGNPFEPVVRHEKKDLERESWDHGSLARDPRTRALSTADISSYPECTAADSAFRL